MQTRGPRSLLTGAIIDRPAWLWWAPWQSGRCRTQGSEPTLPSARSNWPSIGEIPVEDALGELMFGIFGSDISDRLATATVVVCIGAIGIAIMTCAFYGWGRLTRRLTGLSTGTWPVTTALGLASVLFLGGLPKLCRLAHPGTLAGVVVAGLMPSVLAKCQPSREWPRNHTLT